MKVLSAFVLFLYSSIPIANDGAYFMSGNQLISIKEASVQVRKEILSLKRLPDDFLEVNC